MLAVPNAQRVETVTEQTRETQQGYLATGQRDPVLMQQLLGPRFQ
jgi:hypothetical protein